MFRRIIPYFTLICIVLTSTFFLWFPFLFRFPSWFGLKIENSNFQYIYKQFDGPLYIIPAKTLYNPKEIAKINRDSSLSQDPKYFAAHLPLYPLLIRFVSPILGYLKAMLGVNLIFSGVLVCLFYYVLRHFKLTKNPLLLSSIFLFFPRFLVVRSTGAPESLFIFLIFLSLYFFESKRFVLASIVGALSVMTKTPGILLFFAYGLVGAEHIARTRKVDLRFLWIGIIPLGLLSVFVFYWLQTGNFLSYFQSGDNVHLVFPFSVFNFQAKWVGTAWLEDILFYFFIYGLTVIYLKNSKYRSFYYFALVFFTATLFIQHRDISRYSLPLWPLACIALEQFLTSPKLRPILFLLLPGIFFYAWNFLVYNIMPITEWLPFL